MFITLIRRTLKEDLPTSILKPAGNVLSKWQRFINKRRKASEVFDEEYEVFDEEYKANMWDGKSGELCSGHGSFGKMYASYCIYVANLLERLNIQNPRILDVGCGDFRVGSHLLAQLRRPVRYIGIDVARSIIEYHSTQIQHIKFAVPHSVRFIWADASEEKLPEADLCLIRQVFQHLSNMQIKQILGNTSEIGTLLVTEEQLADTRGIIPNKDKAHGPDTRLTDHSGVYRIVAVFFNWH